MSYIGLDVRCKYGGLYEGQKEEGQTERRREKRCQLDSAINIAFYNNSVLYRASLVDLTSKGARFMLHSGTPVAMPTLSEGRKMECYVLTPNGRSKCRGIVRWSCRNGCRLVWGISFIELSIDDMDPFRMVINEVCHGRELVPVTGMAIY